MKNKIAAIHSFNTVFCLFGLLPLGYISENRDNTGSLENNNKEVTNSDHYYSDWKISRSD